MVGIRDYLASEKKKQAKSAVMYRVSEATQTPENKKQVKSAVMYRVSRRVTPPEKKKQAKSAVIYRVSDSRKSEKQVIWSYCGVFYHINNTDLKILMSRRSKS